MDSQSLKYINEPELDICICILCNFLYNNLLDVRKHSFPKLHSGQKQSDTKLCVQKWPLVQLRWQSSHSKEGNDMIQIKQPLSFSDRLCLIKVDMWLDMQVGGVLIFFLEWDDPQNKCGCGRFPQTRSFLTGLTNEIQCLLPKCVWWTNNILIWVLNLWFY